MKNQIKHQSILIESPELAKQWHPTKNGNLNPKNITSMSNRKIWWFCSKCHFEWQSTPANRIRHTSKCPNCETHSTKIVIPGINDLATSHPDLAKEWHSSKNLPLTPQNITYGYGKKVWWICPHGHEYQATPNKRTAKKNPTGCPICAQSRQTSFCEQAFYYYIKKLYPDAINRYKAPFLIGMELDIYIPSIRWGIEYDGEAWHKGKRLITERKKYSLCQKNQIKLIRFREKGVQLNENIADEIYTTHKMYEDKNLENMIIWFLQKIDFSHKRNFKYNPFDVDIKRDRIQILNTYETVLKKDSFGSIYPELAKQWHPTKNKKLTPFMFLPKSDHKVWWLCPVCGYEYQSAIGHRTSGCGCIKCSIKKVTALKEKSVKMIDPKTGKVLKIFDSISKASRELKINSSNICMVCKGIRPKAGGYKWLYTK